MKLAVVIDKSESYISFQKENVLKEWGISDTDVEVVDSFSRVGEEDIFGEALTAVMNVSSVDQWKKLVSDVEKSAASDELSYKVRKGLIITTNIARNSTKKFEGLIKKWGGEVVVAKESSKDKTNVAADMLSVLSLSPEARKFLIDYAADDYDSLIPVIQSLSDVPKNFQNKISIDDLLIRLPRPPGSIPPWEIEKPLLAGDADLTIETYRRIVHHNHYLVVLSILKNKFTLMWRISALLENNSRMTDAQISMALGVAKNYPFNLACASARKFGFQKLSNVLEVIINCEAQVKGGSSASSSVIMEMTLIKILEILK